MLSFSVMGPSKLSAIQAKYSNKMMLLTRQTFPTSKSLATVNKPNKPYEAITGTLHLF